MSVRHNVLIPSEEIAKTLRERSEGVSRRRRSKFSWVITALMVAVIAALLFFAMQASAQVVYSGQIIRTTKSTGGGGGGTNITLAPVGNAPNANGATAVGTDGGTILNLEPASASFPGVVTTGTQAFTGDKTINGALTTTGTVQTSLLLSTGEVRAGAGAGFRATGPNTLLLSSSVPDGANTAIRLNSLNTLANTSARLLSVQNNSVEKMFVDPAGGLGFSGALIPNGSAGTSGQVLTSAGAGVAPTWQTPSGGVSGSGVSPFLAYWTSPTALSNSNKWSMNGGQLLSTTDGSIFFGDFALEITRRDNAFQMPNPLIQFLAHNASKSGFDFTNGSEHIMVVQSVPPAVGIGPFAPGAGFRLDVQGPTRVQSDFTFSGALLPNALPGTTGQVLTSQGAGVAPIWAAAGGGGAATLVNASAGTSTPGTGTVTTSIGSIITGTGTSFLTQLKVGSLVTANSDTHTVVSISSNTDMIVDSPAAWSGSTFTFRDPPISATAVSGSQALSVGATGLTTFMGGSGSVVAALQQNRFLSFTGGDTTAYMGFSNTTGALTLNSDSNPIIVNTTNSAKVLSVTDSNTEVFAVTAEGFPIFSSQNGITAAAGGGQASATQLFRAVNYVTVVATAGNSVKLPAATVGVRITVYNLGANSMNVFGQTGSAIDASGTNGSIAMAAGTSKEFNAQTSTQWRSR